MMILLALVLTAAAPTPARPLDACHVLTKKEIAAVQGESYTGAKLTAVREGTTQCFYQLPTFMRSVSVDVIHGGGREYWEEHFDRDRRETGDRGEDAEAEREESKPPREVPGIGDDAVWAGGRIAGSLYVRKGDSMLRVSVGGPGTEEQKLARSKTLARKALRRM